MSNDILQTAIKITLRSFFRAVVLISVQVRKISAVYKPRPMQCVKGENGHNPNTQRDKPIRRDSETWHAARLEGAKPR